MVITDLDIITAAGEFSPKLAAQAADKTIVVQAIATGDPTAIIVDVEGSLDGLKWAVLESHTFTSGELTDLSAFFYVTNKPAVWIRVNASTLTFTTSGTLTIKISDGV